MQHQSQTNNLLDAKSSLTKKSAFAIALVSVFSMVAFIGISHVGVTLSVYSDVERSLNNFFQADPLAFSVTLATTTIDLSNGSQTVTPTFALEEGSEQAQYSVETKQTTGDSDLCGALHVSSTLPLIYQGPLFTMLTGTTSDVGPWSFTVSLDTALAGPRQCIVEIVYKGWNDGVPAGHGYRDEEHLLLTFYLTAAPDAPADLGVVEGASTEIVPDAVPEATSSEATSTAPAPEPLPTNTSTSSDPAPEVAAPDPAPDPVSDPAPPTPEPPADQPLESSTASPDAGEQSLQ